MEITKKHLLIGGGVILAAGLAYYLYNRSNNSESGDSKESLRSESKDKPKEDMRTKIKNMGKPQFKTMGSKIAVLKSNFNGHELAHTIQQGAGVKINKY